MIRCLCLALALALCLSTYGVAATATASFSVSATVLATTVNTPAAFTTVTVYPAIDPATQIQLSQNDRIVTVTY
jgi:hypothetical protein